MTRTKGGTFELRESHSTPRGPRSRTLATFKELDAETLEKALARAQGSPSRQELIAAALRAGATVAATPTDRAAQALIRSLAQGGQLDGKLRRLLLASLAGEGAPAAEWLGATMAERGEALRDLLLLTDALPVRGRAKKIGFPRIDSDRAR